MSAVSCDSARTPSRVALIGIIVSHPQSVDQLNALLHRYSQWIIGRMGIPYAKRDVNIISVAVDAPQDIISALSGKLGRLPGVNAKAIYSKVPPEKEAVFDSPDASAIPSVLTAGRPAASERKRP